MRKIFLEIKIIFLLVAIALLSQFVLVFFGLPFINGFVGFVGGVFFFGLLRVFVDIYNAKK